MDRRNHCICQRKLKLWRNFNSRVCNFELHIFEMWNSTSLEIYSVLRSKFFSLCVSRGLIKRRRGFYFADPKRTLNLNRREYLCAAARRGLSLLFGILCLGRYFFRTRAQNQVYKSPLLSAPGGPSIANETVHQIGVQISSPSTESK